MSVWFYLGVLGEDYRGLKHWSFYETRIYSGLSNRSTFQIPFMHLDLYLESDLNKTLLLYLVLCTNRSLKSRFQNLREWQILSESILVLLLAGCSDLHFSWSFQPLGIHLIFCQVIHAFKKCLFKILNHISNVLFQKEYTLLPCPHIIHFLFSAGKLYFMISSACLVFWVYIISSWIFL